MSSLAAQLIAVSVAILQRQTIHNQVVSRTTWNTSYDYIVVGAGTAGCVMASRISEDTGNSVLLLEAGGHGSVISDIPATSLIQIDPTENDWGYSTTPQTNVANMFRNRRVRFFSGRVLGGSSVINFMVYNRGNSRDYDNWANNFGLADWSYQNLLPYFRRSEHLYNTSYFANSTSYHGTSGPVATSLPSNADPIHKKYVQGWVNQGSMKIDFNSGQQVGAGIFQQTIDPRTWTRASAAKSYIYPVINRTNLNIVAKAQVTRILIRNNAAYALEFQREGRTYSVQANREIILSAGAINTPQILQLSGIGPRNELSRLNVPLISDLSVGENFQDHVLVPLFFRVNNASDINWDRFMHTRLTVSNLYDYYIHQNGPLTQFPISAHTAISSVNNNNQWPDNISANIIFQVNDDFLNTLTATADPAAWLNYFKPLSNDQRLFIIFCGIYRIHSRGTIRLASNDPFQAPLIDPNYLADSRDMTAAIDSVQTVLNMTDSDYFRSIASFYDESLPGCENELCGEGVPVRLCRKYLACVVKMLGLTSWHPVGTARMGTNITNSVVDSRLRVHGIRNLRVIDASVMPQIPNGNTNAATFAIAEKAADIIRHNL